MQIWLERIDSIIHCLNAALSEDRLALYLFDDQLLLTSPRCRGIDSVSYSGRTL